MVLAPLLVASTVISVTKQSISTFELELEQLKGDILPNQLQRLSLQISSEIMPSIIASQLMANNPFIQKWIKEGSDDAMLASLENDLQSTQKMLGSDFTFHGRNAEWHRDF